MRKQIPDRESIVAQGNKHLIETARQAGVQSKNFGRFHNEGYLGQYQMTEKEIGAYKDIPEGEEILNHMGRQELFANGFRITQTDDKLAREKITGEEKAMETHFNVGRQVRKAIEAIGGTMPEDLPAEPSIKKQFEERRRKRKRLKAKPQDQGETLL